MTLKEAKFVWNMFKVIAYAFGLLTIILNIMMYPSVSYVYAPLTAICMILLYTADRFFMQRMFTEFKLKK